MICSAQTLRVIKPVSPFEERTRHNGFTYGLGPAGYDIRVREQVDIYSGEFELASSLEYFSMPGNILGVVHDKSTWARLGLCVQNTVIEPGWRGYLTIELTNHNFKNKGPIRILPGTPICQVIFHILDKPTAIPYEGKYQDQKEGVQPAIIEHADKA
jgi:dCTP deaminase